MGKKATIIDEFTDLDITGVRRFQLRRQKRGICRYCPAPLKTKTLCARHAARASRAHKRHNARNPLKHAARVAVTRALIRGELVRQKCEECDTLGQAHHEDYSKPLDVRWLCRKHHARREGRKFQDSLRISRIPRCALTSDIGMQS